MEILLIGNDDVDLGIHIRYLDRFRELLPVLKKHGFHLSHTQLNCTTYNFVRDSEKVDIDFFGHHEMCVSAANTCDSNFACSCDGLIKYLQQPSVIRYRDLVLYAPHEKYLESVYGDWKTPKR